MVVLLQTLKSPCNTIQLYFTYIKPMKGFVDSFLRVVNLGSTSLLFFWPQNLIRPWNILFSTSRKGKILNIYKQLAARGSGKHGAWHAHDDTIGCKWEQSFSMITLPSLPQSSLLATIYPHPSFLPYKESTTISQSRGPPGDVQSFPSVLLWFLLCSKP